MTRRNNQPQELRWQQKERRNAVPGIEIAVAQIRQKTAEGGNSAKHETPPSTRFGLSQRKLHQPQIQPANGNQRATERHAVVKHKMNNATLVDAAKLLLVHPEEPNVMREKMSCCRQEQR